MGTVGSLDLAPLDEEMTQPMNPADTGVNSSTRGLWGRLGVPSSWLSRSSLGTVVALVTLVVGLPLILAVIALVGTRWYPVLDLAMTELRVRDVGTRQTPLIGLPGRIGQFPDQGSHPGPLSFWLLTAPYRILGSSAWALQAAAVAVNLAAVAAAIWVGVRRAGVAGAVVVAAVIAVVIRGYGIGLFTQPWNPYLPLILWIVVLLTTWSVLCGDHRMLVPLVIASSFCAQTHVPYLVLCVGMVALALVAVVLQAVHARSAPPRQVVLSVAAAAGVGGLAWSPAFVDQIVRSPGNLSMLAEHFTGPSETPIGLRAGFELSLRHLDLVGGFARLAVEPGTFVTQGFDPTGRLWPGALLLGAWAVAAAASWRLGHAVLLRLHAVLALALLLGLVSMSRIFGKVWYYLTLWAWGTATVMVAAVVWTAFAWWRRSQTTDVAARGARSAVMAAAAVAIAASLGSIAESVRATPPEQHLSDTLGEVLGPTLEAIDAGVGDFSGTAGIYRVSWDDAYFFGSQGYGLVSELERAGYRAGVDPPWRVPVTAHRVLRAEEVTAGVHLATGFHVERWRNRSEAIEVAFVEPRSPEQLDEYAQLREVAVTGLEEAGLFELVDLVDTNLFLVSNDVRVPAPAARAMARMLILGQETAVFMIPADAAR
jgi:hypothetical protein